MPPRPRLRAQPKRRRLTRLDDAEIDLLIARYQAGASTRQLAMNHSAHRHTITKASVSPALISAMSADASQTSR